MGTDDYNDDTINEAADIAADTANEIAGEKPRLKSLVNHTYDGLLPITLFCALAGLLLGPLPGVICTLAVGSVFYPVFVAAPLIMCLLSVLLKGCRDVRALVVITVFSLAAAYLTALSCQAALYVMSYSGMSVTGIPLVTVLSIGKSGVLPASASAYVYPLLFTALGVIIAWDVLRVRDNKETA